MKALMVGLILQSLSETGLERRDCRRGARPNPAPVDPDTRREIGPTVLPEERVREMSNPLFIQKLDI